MNFALASDLHHEFYKEPPTLPVVEADVLVLAGDIETDKSHSDAWWDETAKHYKSVIYIPGNHEYYKSYYTSRKQHWFPENVIKVGRIPQIIQLNGFRILAGTMWTDLSNPLHSFYAKQSMNDYRLIKYSQSRYWFTPEDTTREFISFKTMLEEDKPDIVISHHLPSYGSVHPMYKDDRLNCAYATEMDMEGVKIWMHGHTHTPCDYYKQGCRVVCNPKGYPNEGSEGYMPQVIEYD